MLREEVEGREAHALNYISARPREGGDPGVTWLDSAFAEMSGESRESLRKNPSVTSASTA